MKSPSASLIQIALGVIVLGASVISPRAQSATLLVPLDAAAVASRLPLGGETGLSLIGPGRPEGSLVVYARDGIAAWDLLRQGIIPLAVPYPGCGDGK